MTAEQLIDRLRQRPRPEGEIDVTRARAALERESAKAPLPDGTTVEGVDAGGAPAEWVRGAAAADDAAVLYIHGGGYTMGSPATHRALAAHLSNAAGAGVLLVDYRLAPEHPFPAGLDDTRAAWRWLLTQPGITPGRCAIGGDSAGGGLAAATVLALRDAGDPLPAAVGLLSPWVDLTLSGDSHRTLADADPMVDAATLSLGVRSYAGDADLRHPYLSPLHGDWSGTPPLLVQVGSEEVLLDDSRSLAAAAKDAGVEVTLEEWAGMVHVFQSFCGLIDDADRAVAGIGEFFRRHFG